MFKMIETKFSKRKFIESKNKKTSVPFSFNSLGALCRALRCLGCVLEGLTNKKERDKIGAEGDK